MASFVKEMNSFKPTEITNRPSNININTICTTKETISIIFSVMKRHSELFTKNNANWEKYQKRLQYFQDRHEISLYEVFADLKQNNINYYLFFVNNSDIVYAKDLPTFDSIKSYSDVII